MDQIQAPSPFIPDTAIQYAWDSTSIGYLKTCPRLYYYTMIEGWSPKEDSVHLRFGSEYHTALQDFDIARAEGADFEEAVKYSITALVDRTRDFNPDQDHKAGRYKNRDTLLSLTIDYFDHFRNDQAKTLILNTGAPAVELSFKFNLDFGPRTDKSMPYFLCGHLDRVVDYNESLFVMDRKTTTTTLGEYYFNQFQPNNQMSLYTLASQIVINSPVKGVIIDAAQILLDNPNRFIRDITYRTPDQTNEWVEGLEYWLALGEEYALAQHWPMNDTACDKFGGCKFREICSSSPQVRQRFLEAKFIKLPEEEKWNPLKPR